MSLAAFAFLAIPTELAANASICACVALGLLIENAAFKAFSIAVSSPVATATKMFAVFVIAVCNIVAIAAMPASVLPLNWPDLIPALMLLITSPIEGKP